MAHTIEETRAWTTDMDKAHDGALKEAAIRAARPDRSGWLMSNHQYAELAHRVVVKESRGAAGTLWSFYRAPLCGAKMGSAYGSSWNAELPQAYRACPKCERAAKAQGGR